MKKLLLVLMVVAMASFLFVGCLTVPDGPGDEDEDENGEVELCPTVAVSDSVAVDSKTYLKAGSHTITVTFDVETEPVSVYVGPAIKTFPVGISEYAVEVVMYTTDKKIYTGTYIFGLLNDDALTCGEDYIYVVTCDTCAPCKTAFIVDEDDPYANIKISEVACACADESYVKFDSAWTSTEVECVVPGGCCGDACSGLATWTIDIYDRDPYGDCCAADPCAVVFDNCAGTACPVLCTTNCTDDWFATSGTQDFYAIIELEDKVGNSTKYYAKLTFDTDELVSVYSGSLDAVDCTWDWVTATDGIIGVNCTTFADLY